MNQNEINQLVQSGISALQQKTPQIAKNAFETLINNGVQNASIWLALGIAYKDLNDTERAHNAASESIKLEERNPRAYILRANLYYQTDDHHAAAAFYRIALNATQSIGQIPADLKVELDQAKSRYDDIIGRYTNYLHGLLDEDIRTYGATSRRAQASIDILTGRKEAYTQQPKNYYFPELPNIQFYDPAEFEWVPSLEASTDAIKEELKKAIQLGQGFSPYLKGDDNRPQSDPHGMVDNQNWSAFYLWKDGYLVEENARICPTTVEMMRKIVMPEIKDRAPNVLFSLLKPGATIPPHNGLINTRLICHLPLIIPDGCGFRVGNDSRKWEEGKVWLFDDTIEHEAWNNSDQDRYILLFEVWRPELSDVEQKLVTKILESVDAYQPTN